ncbi:hypothetical protein ASPVEDRAFT_35450 [Aspergillus versicolor CBS 583.65]|uniref:Uncharacterized protein n=1 Tax=Aspergillus versicolor CBS 583.65 TaxID=1036611 RepID=A0A1L9P3K2_ASPVE|nr:uncharacterized protein ASPVEDRAFT_35450 [Aspergillus versicolor CBS 583.65]OJI96105.1 hypothetical protein ASPVEDRAFT_35450 [Aspergillus versicolor CBS 583.65]
MQRLWSHSAAPTSHCLSCLSTTAVKAAPRTVPTTSMRRLRIKDSPTARCTGFFAAAASTEAPANGKHRRRWEERIAPVNEANELFDEGGYFLGALSPLRTPNLFRTAFQTRRFHTLPRPTHRTIRSPITQTPRRLSHFSSNVGLDTEGVDPAVQELEAEKLAPIEEADDDFDMAIDVEDVPDWLKSDVLRAKAIKKLALKQLAIRLVLRPAIAHSYFGILKNYDDDASTPQLDLPGLLFELNATRRRIRQIKSNPTANIEDLTRGISIRRLKEVNHRSRQLENRFRQDTDLYMGNEMPLEEYLLRLSSNLLDVQDPDQAYTFTKMIIAFTKTRQNDIARLVIKTILPYKFQLSPSLITAIIVFFRKSKDLNGFDLFLKMLEGKGYPIELGSLGYYKAKTVNGIEVSVPPVHSANVVIYAALIRACLRFDQPDRADAYLMVARGAGNLDDFAILMSYLEFYAIRRNWEKGLPVLQRALAFIASTTEHPPQRVERLIRMMVHLCDSCRMLEASDAVIEASVNSGFSPDLPRKQKDIVSEFDPESQRWWTIAETSVPRANLTKADQYLEFVRIVGEYLDKMPIPGEGGSARRLQRLSQIYSRRVLTSVVEGRLAGKAMEEDTREQGIINDALKTIQAENENASTSLEGTMAAQQQEIVTLRSEVAQLKEMVLHLSQHTTAPRTKPTSDPEELIGDTSAPASGESPPQNGRAGGVSS